MNSKEEEEQKEEEGEEKGITNQPDAHRTELQRKEMQLSFSLKPLNTVTHGKPLAAKKKKTPVHQGVNLYPKHFYLRRCPARSPLATWVHDAHTSQTCVCVCICLEAKFVQGCGFQSKPP